MKRKLIILTAILVTTITAALATRTNAFLNVRYTDSAFPSICQYPGTRPNDCTQTSPGVVCTLVVGTHTYTYYQFSSCVTPWYRID